MPEHSRQPELGPRTTRGALVTCQTRPSTFAIQHATAFPLDHLRIPPDTLSHLLTG